ncbi:nuclear transport factor 2 family protein [Nonomuraea angiospora]|uniref:nuclear transport factor 2 family protein n=1 Tax=Nonomuraea angiospora TaxID=46172 RepID=UPI003330DEC2
MGEDYASVAKQFIESYYSTAKANRSGLGSLYRESSVLTFGNDVKVGPAAIVEYLDEYVYLGEELEHKVHYIDAVPQAGGTVAVLASGALMWPDAPPMLFAEMFVLMQDGGSYYVGNETLQLVSLDPSDTYSRDD